MRRFVPSTTGDRKETEVSWSQDEAREANLLAAAGDPAEAAILLRVPTAMKTALTIEAGKLTAATGTRVSVNALVKTMIANALNEMAKGEDESA